MKYKSVICIGLGLALLLSSCGNTSTVTPSSSGQIYDVKEDKETVASIAPETSEKATEEEDKQAFMADLYAFFAENPVLTNDLNSIEDAFNEKIQNQYEGQNLQVAVIGVKYDSPYEAYQATESTGSVQEGDEGALETGIYLADVAVKDARGNIVQGELKVYMDKEAPYLMNSEGKVASFNDQVIHLDDVNAKPSYDLSDYYWKDNESVASSEDSIVCEDEAKHIWKVTLKAEDTSGNIATTEYKITVEPKESSSNKSNAASGTAGNSKAGEGQSSDTKANSGGTAGGASGDSDTVANAGAAGEQVASGDMGRSVETPAPQNTGLVLNNVYASDRGMDQQVLDDLNALRASLGLTQLVYDEGMYQVALARANHMIANGYFDHYFNGEAQFTVVADTLGYRKSVMGENIAKTNKIGADGHYMYTMWYNSPTHYENMVYGDFRTVGIAIVPYTTTADYYYTNPDGSKTFAYSDLCTYYMGVQIFGN